jgi:hypothetical protein
MRRQTGSPGLPTTEDLTDVTRSPSAFRARRAAGLGRVSRTGRCRSATEAQSAWAGRPEHNKSGRPINLGGALLVKLGPGLATVGLQHRPLSSLLGHWLVRVCCSGATCPADQPKRPQPGADARAAFISPRYAVASAPGMTPLVRPLGNRAWRGRCRPLTAQTTSCQHNPPDRCIGHTAEAQPSPAMRSSSTRRAKRGPHGPLSCISCATGSRSAPSGVGLPSCCRHWRPPNTPRGHCLTSANPCSSLARYGRTLLTARSTDPQGTDT